MTHLWVRAESRPHEDRVGITPDGVRHLSARGFRITVEDSARRVIATEEYRKAGAIIAPKGSWPDAPRDAIVFGLKELPDDGTPLVHRHIMFGHAYKGQSAGQRLLRRFRDGGGRLLDLEYLTDEDGRRLAAFGYWAGYAGAAVSLMAWIAQMRGGICDPVHAWPDKDALQGSLRAWLDALGRPRPRAIVIGAKGRVGRGARDLMTAMGLRVTEWDLAETAHGGPFPEVLAHQIFVNAILARPGAPVFVPADATGPARALRVIGDVACDPDSDFSPIKVYDRATDWDAPVRRVADNPPLDVMAIDNLPSMLPRESSEDYAAQLLPVLEGLDDPQGGAWGRASRLFDEHAPG
ncbi:saccharopine dehydrogenase [Paracoccus sp. 1_MG-2023]|uniref:saccharopine dehydrogenase n=1 Tax=unclassified Paracoccus (in: a-proteobacteria) TaxID=2688777 RepID=UPI001C09880E|nr:MULTISPECIES: saccharopine dehydrogenase [unclassified Paracoccus (in: a-proteobacteria)]MBU2957349.1 saccharopine dehydrogenase [Paracoccus sp. C2R09]MDO6670112.1 saccharopine dehydrogenase [Paracoccus sp. 1_MG-2023]